MAEVYLEPADVPAFDAGRVLAALNAAPDAEHLAAAIEIPDELDIGIRLGQRLLDRRDQLGGFTSLEQVADVPLIGPERFTEIVVTLAGRSATDLLGLAAGPAGPPGWVTSRSRLGLRLLAAGPWLGQLTTVVVRSTVDGVRRAGVPLLVATGTGRLRAVSGGRVLEGATVTLVTGADGAARATWLPATNPPLDPAAHAALGDALGRLPTSGATPASSLPALRALVTAYRWEPNTALRRAVDALVDQVVVEVDDVDLGAAWPTVETTVTAWALAGGDTPDGGAEAVAVQPLVARDWRAGMVRVHHEVLTGEARLAGHLETERTQATDAVDLIGRLQRRVGEYLDVQQGRLGSAVARAIAADASRTFVVDRTADLSLDDGLQLASVVGATAAAAGTATPAVVTAMATTRSTVLRQVDTAVAAPIQARLDQLGGTVAGKVNEADLAAALAGKPDRAELDEALATRVGRDELGDAVAGLVGRDELDAVVARLVGRDELGAVVDERVGVALEEAAQGFVRRDELDPVVAERVAAALEEAGVVRRDELDEVVKERVQVALDEAGIVRRDELDEVVEERVRAALDEAVQGFVRRDELRQVLEGKLDRAELDEILSRHVSLDDFKSFAARTDARLRRLEG